MSQNVKWVIGCGIILVVGLCIVAVILVSGLLIARQGTTGDITDQASGEVTAQVSLEPASVQPGQQFTLAIQIDNARQTAYKVDEIQIPQSLLDAAILLEVNPPQRDETTYAGSTGYTINLILAPEESQTITFVFEAVTGGEYSGEVLLLAEDGSQTTPVQLAITASAAPTTPTAAQAAPTRAPVVSLGEIPFPAVVQISAMYRESGRLEVGWTGSGSIIDPGGLILTNAHVVLPDKYYAVDALQVALTLQDDRPPEAMYYAEVVQADPALDIAVLRITTDLDGSPVDRAALNLPVVPLGDSDQLRLGDTLTILGYPGIGGDTITLTRGEVSGFTSEPGRGARSFVKTSATIAGGNSGGLAANQSGELVGVPTLLGYGGDDQYVDCRVLADTNRDGEIDDLDSCVPTGGFINALRPIKLALPLIDAARRGEVMIGSLVEEPAEIPTGSSILYQDDFSNQNSGWDVGGGDSADRRYAGGRYEIEVITDNFYAWSNPGRTFGDVVITTTAQAVESTGEGDYGVLCRYQDTDNFYALEISEDGYYSIWKAEDGEFIALVDWEYSSSVPQDGSPVTITAACVADSLTLAANGVQLAQVFDSSFAGGDIGLIAGTWDRGGLVMGYQEIVVHQP